ncbi:MAG: type III pantothenate kinase [Lachnospiraceae bacterium]|nr:type III pantothenate kinase [Lachnospiraceae bacterium]
MILTIDVGNTNINCGIYSKAKNDSHNGSLKCSRELLKTFRLTSRQTRTSDEYGMILTDLLNINRIDINEITGAVIASVVPGVMHALTGAVKRYIGVSPLIVGPGVKTGIKITSENPREIGANRIATAVAGFIIYGGPILVLDFGTATTYDLVTADGSFGAGITAPGISLSAKALWEGTARLPEVEIKKPKSILAGETVSSIQAGIVYGQIGQTEYIIKQVIKETGYKDLKVVATGGLGRIIAAETDTIQTFDSHLTLEGLRIIYEKNNSN